MERPRGEPYRGVPMEPDEVQAEIEQRKKRAEDLRIREVLWCLYDSHFMRYEA